MLPSDLRAKVRKFSLFRQRLCQITAHNDGWRSAALRPELRVDRKWQACCQSNALDPQETSVNRSDMYQRTPGGSCMPCGPRRQTADAEILIASDARPRHTSRGFLPWRFAYAGPPRVPRHHHGPGISKPSHERRFRAAPRRLMFGLAPEMARSKLVSTTIQPSRAARSRH